MQRFATGIMVRSVTVQQVREARVQRWDSGNQRDGQHRPGRAGGTAAPAAPAAGAAILLLLLTATAVTAQEIQIEPRVGIHWQYSDNLLLSPTLPDTDPDPDEDTDDELRPVSDGAWMVEPGLSLGIRGRYASLALRYDAGRTRYQRYPQLDGWRHDLGVGLTARVAPSTALTLRHDFVQTEEPVRLTGLDGDPDVELPPGTDPGSLSVHERQTLNTTSSRLRFSPNATDSLAASYAYAKRDTTETLDGFTRGRSQLEGARLWRGDWQTRLSAARSRTDFDRGDDVDLNEGQLDIGKHVFRDWTWQVRTHVQRVAIGGDSEDDPAAGTGYRVITPETGFAGSFNNGTQAELMLGFFHLTPLGDGTSDNGPAGSLRVTRRFARGGYALRAAAGHGDAFYSRERFDSSRYTLATAGADTALTQTISAAIFGSYRRDRYTLDRITAEERRATTTVSDSRLIRVELGYTPREWLEAGVTYEHIRRDGVAVPDVYGENRVAVTVTMRHPIRTGRIPDHRQPLELPLPLTVAR